MSRPSKQWIAVVAMLLVVSSLAVTWQVADVRESQRGDARKQELVDRQVASRQAPDDYDGDGVPDATDRCPTRPETDNGFRDDDGCPDVVTTTGAS